jgi:uncharacterized caspase-like protein
MIALLASLALAGGAHGVPATGTADAYAPRRVALLIGVDHYSDPALQSLSYAGKDAADLAAVFRDPAEGGYDKVILLPPEQTTRAGILQAMSRVTADLQRDDTFLLYISGHGTLELDPIDGTRLVFLPSDSKLEDAQATGISVEWIESMMSRLDPRRRVLIMDTCHNGRSKSGLSAQTEARLKSLKGDPPPPNTVAQVSESEARLYAAEYYQPAMEDSNLKNGVYTHFLIQALTTDRDAADLNRDGLVDVVEGHAYARDGTIRYTGGAQVPRAEYSIVGNEEIFLAGDPTLRHRAETALFSAYSNILASAHLLVDGRSRGVLPGAIPVEPGRRHIRVETNDGRALLDRTVEVRAGDSTSIEKLLEPEKAEWTVLAGGSLMQGSAASYVAPLGGELQVGWRPSQRGNVRWGLHARANLGHGIAEDKDVPTTSGVGAVGGSVGWSPWPDRLVVGPEAEVVVPWRYLTFDGVPTLASGATLAAGLNATLEQPIGRHNSLVLQYDARVAPWPVYDAWVVGVSQSVAVGVTFQ